MHQSGVDIQPRCPCGVERGWVCGTEPCHDSQGCGFPVQVRIPHPGSAREPEDNRAQARHARYFCPACPHGERLSHKGTPLCQIDVSSCGRIA